MHNLKYIVKVIVDKAVKICEKETICIAHCKLSAASFYSVYFNDDYNFNRLKKNKDGLILQANKNTLLPLTEEHFLLAPTLKHKTNFLNKS